MKLEPIKVLVKATWEIHCVHRTYGFFSSLFLMAD